MKNLDNSIGKLFLRTFLLFNIIILFFLFAYSTTYAFINTDFDTNNSNWTLSAIPPNGWIEIPGNSSYGTSNFLVMKYEAKIQGEADGNKNYNSTYVAQSRADGTPWVKISAPNSSIECSAFGSDYHLLSNNEWMTIARNIEAQATNWSLGTVGQGYLFAGYNNDPSPVEGETIPASTIDTGNYRCAYTDGNRSIENPVSCPTNLSKGTSADSGNQVRTHVLSNGSVIWDFAGNVNEHISDTIDEPDEPVDSTTAFNWQEFTSIISWGTLGRDAYAPANTSYTSIDGVGTIYSGTTNNYCGITVCSIHRGGAFFDSINVGVFMAGLDFDTISESYATGFRCSSNSTATQTFSSNEGVDGGGGNEVDVSTVTDAKLTQSVYTNNSTYTLFVYIKDKTSGNENGPINSSIAQLYDNNSAISNNYELVGGGWWKLSSTIYGSGNSRDFGIIIKAGHNVVVDQFGLNGPSTNPASSSSFIQIPEIFSLLNNPIIANPIIDSNTSGQIVLTIIQPQTFSFNAYLSANKINIATLSNNQKLSNSSVKSNTVFAGYGNGMILGFKSKGITFWQVGGVQELWYKGYASAGFEAAKIIPDLQTKSSIIALKYNDFNLVPNGQPKTKFTESKLKLAHSLDGKNWTILNSVVDPINNTVSTIGKVGGYYMIIGSY